MIRDPISVIKLYEQQIPIPVYTIIQEIGLELDFELLDENISGWIERTIDSNYRIVVNSRHSENRQRFTAAHELGHFIYHRDLLGVGTGDTRAYRAEGTILPNRHIRARHERQANSFAANLLMPTEAVARLRAAKGADLAVTAEKLGVSEEALKVRLGA